MNDALGGWAIALLSIFLVCSLCMNVGVIVTCIWLEWSVTRKFILNHAWAQRMFCCCRKEVVEKLKMHEKVVEQQLTENEKDLKSVVIPEEKKTDYKQI